MTNQKLLEQKIKDSGLKIDFICKATGIPYSTLRSKIRNESEFTAPEIVALCNVLKINKKEREAIFFMNKVDK